MTLANEFTQEKRFVPSVLPWILAGAALLVYLLTLNHWISLSSMGNVGLVSGWFWQPDVSRPLYWLVTLPIRLLPASLIPVALNLFAALCAAATLALLARSVALLPQDRTEDQRLREHDEFSLLSIRKAWLPPVLAVLVCGLQLTFWENATAASGDIFDLLLFAYVVRCLLEFRLQASDSWLLRACFVYGAAMTNNWAMIAFFPVFVAWMIGVKGIGFFNLRFLMQAVVLGAIGLCFYLLLPALVGLSSGGEVGFGDAVKAHFIEQKRWLGIVFNRGTLFRGDNALWLDRPLWVLALPSLLPVFAISLRWPSYFGDPSRMGVALATVVFHFLHAALFLVCLWVTLDPEFSPRNYLGMPGLPLYYLGALSIGYLAGYFLLIFGGARPMLRLHPLPGYPPALNSVVTGAVWTLLFLVPAGLIYRNLPQIRTTNGPMLRQFTELMARDVPASGSVVLSDDPLRLLLLKSFWIQKHTQNPGLLLDTKALPTPFYHRFLAKQYPGRWKADSNRKAPFQDAELLSLVSALSATNGLYYLHPSFGYYYEVFFPEPHGLVYQLKRYPTNTLIKPLLTKEQTAENEQFWSATTSKLLQQIRKRAAGGPDPAKATVLDRVIEPLLERVHVTSMVNLDASVLGRYCSRALDALGVDLQRQSLYPQAAGHFMTSKELFTNNVVAQINLEFNRTVQDKTPSTSRSVEEWLGKRTIQDAMNEYGPFDEPRFCYMLGRGYFEFHSYRQAAQEFNRVAQLVPEGQPEHLASRLLLARASMVLGLMDEGLKIVSDIHARASSLGLSGTNAPDLLQLETIAYFSRKDTNSAVKAIETALKTYPTNVYVLNTASTLYLQSGMTNSALKLVDTAWNTYPRDTYLLETAIQVYLYAGLTNSADQLIGVAVNTYPRDESWLAAATKLYLDSGCYSNALTTAAQQLKMRPDNVSATFAKGVALLQLNQYPDAAAAFTPVVQLGTNDVPTDFYYSALANRAYAFWKGDKLDEAQQDYEVLQRAFTNAIQFSYVLGEIAYGKKDSRGAIRYYTQFLQRAPTNSPEASNASARLKELNGARR